MRKLLLCAMVVAAATPAWSQTKPKAGRADPCAPIGQTANRELVYPMNCNNLPAPPPLPPQAEVQQAPAPAPEPRRSVPGCSACPLIGSAVPAGREETNDRAAISGDAFCRSRLRN